MIIKMMASEMSLTIRITDKIYERNTFDRLMRRMNSSKRAKHLSTKS